MYSLSLREHVGFGMVGDRPVFLDLKRDRYLSLDGETGRAFARFRENGGTLAREEAERLLDTGLFEESEGAGPLAPARAVPARYQLEIESPARTPMCDRIRVWRQLRRIARELRSLPLHDMLARRALHALPEGAGAERATDLARRFVRARSAAPVAPRCLPDSLALWDWLRARGTSGSIVFGVKLEPFGAHCWVQHGPLVLNEAIDRTCEYRPVFVFP